jgi:hypothetical protein
MLVSTIQYSGHPPAFLKLLVRIMINAHCDNKTIYLIITYQASEIISASLSCTILAKIGNAGVIYLR